MLINNILSVSCVGMSRNWGFVEEMQPVKDKEVQSQEMRPGRVVRREMRQVVVWPKKRNKFQKLVSCNFLSTEAEGLSDY